MSIWDELAVISEKQSLQSSSQSRHPSALSAVILVSKSGFKRLFSSQSNHSWLCVYFMAAFETLTSHWGDFIYLLSCHRRHNSTSIVNMAQYVIQTIMFTVQAPV